VIEVQSVQELTDIWRQYSRFCDTSPAKFPTLTAQWQLLEVVYQSLASDMQRFIRGFEPCGRQLSQEGTEIQARRASKPRPRLAGGAS
jgi:hypothetical protein